MPDQHLTKSVVLLLSRVCFCWGFFFWLFYSFLRVREMEEGNYRG